MTTSLESLYFSPDGVLVLCDKAAEYGLHGSELLTPDVDAVDVVNGYGYGYGDGSSFGGGDGDGFGYGYGYGNGYGYGDGYSFADGDG